MYDVCREYGAVVSERIPEQVSDWIDESRRIPVLHAGCGWQREKRLRRRGRPPGKNKLNE
jgi:hypothetical protein